MIANSDSEYSTTLKYSPSSIEGQCILEKITPVKRSQCAFVLFVIVSILFVGLPALIVYWYPWLRRKLYYVQSTVEEATHFHIINYDQSSTYPPKQNVQFQLNIRQAKQTVLFENRYLKYLVQNETVKAAEFQYVPELLKVIKEGYKGIGEQQTIQKLRNSYGLGTMIVQNPSVPLLFVREVMRPLYLFIVFSCSLWFYQSYVIYASIILGTAIIGIVTNLFQTYQLNKKIYEMAFHEQKIKVLRNSNVEQISSVDLVPGDLAFIQGNIKLPFDGFILEGSALINQCALTGQSVPVVKKAGTDVTEKGLKSSALFEGTLILQTNNRKKILLFEAYRQAYGLPVFVTRTNFSTMKGQLIRIISFPKQKENIFQRQSTKFLLFLFSLAIMSYIFLIVKLHTIVEPLELFLKFLDLITITVPPGLPVSMTFGIIFALQKMKAKQIYCSSPNKVITGGMIDFLCFDKTGTLTEDFMDFHCLVPSNKKQFSKQVKNQKTENQSNKKIAELIVDNPLIIPALNNMAMNHSIVELQETKQLIGDPMEVKLFEFGEFVFSSDDNSDPEIIFSVESIRGHKTAAYRRYDFDSDLFRMSVVGTTSFHENELHIYTKGSPEQMLSVFDESSVPIDYKQILNKYTSKGLRVLSLGSKKIQKTELNKTREELEVKLNFDGFQVFENPLKKETKLAIFELHAAQLPCVMITGDHALTAANIAYMCNISDETKQTYIYDYDNETNQFTLTKFNHTNKAIEEQNFNSQVSLNITQKSSGHILTDYKPNQQIIVSKTVEQSLNMALKTVEKEKAQLCITGGALNLIFSGDKQNTNLQLLQSKVLGKTTVFARAKPNDKVKIVKLYQQSGKKVSMCGDGANDCGALKQAHIGLSLSQAQASISAPFTSRITNISSMVELIKQCRAGLATNFSLFNIMALYSLIQYTTAVICQYHLSYPADFQYLYWDIFCNFLFFITFGYTGTVQKLTNNIPSGSLFTVSNITQVLIMFGLQLAGQILMIVGLSQFFNEQIGYHNQITYEQYVEEGDFILNSYENNILFLFTNLMYVFTLLAFSISHPWRKSFITNPFFVVILALILVYNLVMTVVPNARLSLFDVIHLNHQPLNWYIFGMALGIGVLIYVNQKFFLEPLFNWLKQKFPNKKWI